MKRLHRIGLAGLLLVSASLAHSGVIIQVTTTADENGENPNACSLREAVTARNVGTDFGGCTWGDTVQLSDATYTLNSELQISSSLTIQGADHSNSNAIDPFTATKPTRFAPTTVITGAGSHRIALVLSNGSLSLQNLILTNGMATAESSIDGAIPADGGLIFARGSLSLTNVEASYGSASGNGGAFALYANGSGIAFTSAYLHDNKASGRGGALFIGPIISSSGSSGSSVIANSCAANGVPHVHSIVADGSTFRNNSASQGADGLDVCGSTAVALTNTTFQHHRNDAAVSFKYSANTSSLIAQNVTFVDNLKGLQLGVSGPAKATIKDSVFYWNFQDCDLAAAGSTLPTLSPSSNRYNLFGSSCSAWLGSGAPDAPNTAGSSAYSESYGGTDSTDGSLSDLQWVAPPTGLVDISQTVDTLPVPVLRPVSGSKLVSAGSAKAGDCAGTDARGVQRQISLPSSSGSSSSTPVLKACDLGAVERKTLTAIGDSGNNKPLPPGPGPSRQVTVSILDNDIAPEGKSNLNLQQWGVTAVTGGCVYDSQRHVLTFDGSIYDGTTTAKSTPQKPVCYYQLCGDAECSAAGLSAPAKVEITVTNQAPLANDDYATVHGGDTISISVLANDYDQDGGNSFFNALDPSTVTITAMPSVGRLRCASTRVALSTSNVATCPGGVILYTPNDNYANFADSFSYTVKDHDGAVSNAAAVHVLSANLNSPANGGASGWWFLPGLLWMGWWRRRS